MQSWPDMVCSFLIFVLHFKRHRKIVKQVRLIFFFPSFLSWANLWLECKFKPCLLFTSMSVFLENAFLGGKQGFRPKSPNHMYCANLKTLISRIFICRFTSAPSLIVASFTHSCCQAFKSIDFSLKEQINTMLLLSFCCNDLIVGMFSDFDYCDSEVM